ncbi:dTDP-4-dehydrorhamnose 3,5-epimerase [Bradyrhizobium sp. USDA 4353]
MYRNLEIPEVVLFTPRRFEDSRGHFCVTYNQKEFAAAVGGDGAFVQDNESLSRRGVLRGLHYQLGAAQDKLVRACRGEIFDVAIDLRRNSPTFGKWVGEVLSEGNGAQLWVPKGFAHGFLVLSETAVVSYKVTDYWSPQDERCIQWNDPDLAIQWPNVGCEIILSPKDAVGMSFADAEYF